MKFKGPEDRKKRILNDRRVALENDVSQSIIQLILSSLVQVIPLSEFT